MLAPGGDNHDLAGAGVLARGAHRQVAPSRVVETPDGQGGPELVVGGDVVAEGVLRPTEVAMGTGPARTAEDDGDDPGIARRAVGVVGGRADDQLFAPVDGIVVSGGERPAEPIVGGEPPAHVILEEGDLVAPGEADAEETSLSDDDPSGPGMAEVAPSRLSDGQSIVVASPEAAGSDRPTEPALRIGGVGQVSFVRPDHPRRGGVRAGGGADDAPDHARVGDAVDFLEGRPDHQILVEPTLHLAGREAVTEAVPGHVRPSQGRLLEPAA